MAISAKTKLRKAIESLTEEEALDLLDYLNLHRDPDVLTAEEKASVQRGEEEIAGRQTVSLEELRKKRG